MKKKIVRNNKQVLVEGEVKKYRFTFNKRFISDDCPVSYPFGFCFLEKLNSRCCDSINASVYDDYRWSNAMWKNIFYQTVN